MYLSINGVQTCNLSNLRDASRFGNEIRLTFMDGCQFHYYFKTLEEAKNAYGAFWLSLDTAESQHSRLATVAFINYSTTPIK